MSEEKRAEPPLSLETAYIPIGFLSLASAALAMLEDNGVCLFKTTEEGDIEHIHPEAIAFVTPPVLVVDPAAILDYDEDNGTILINKAGCLLLKSSVLAAADTLEE